MYSKEKVSKMLPEKMKNDSILEISKIDEGIELEIHVKLFENNDVIIKVHETDWYDSNRGFLAGPHLMSKLSKKDSRIPIPEVYKIVESDEVSSKPYYVMEYIEDSGVTLDQMDEKKKKELLRNAGKYLAMINNLDIDIQGVGYVKYQDEVLEGESETISDFITNRIRQFSEDIEDGGFSLDERNEEDTKFYDKVSEINHISDYTEDNNILECTEPSYCHWDYKRDNMLIQDSEIIGIIDWENPIVCDRLYNLARAEEKFLRFDGKVQNRFLEEFQNSYCEHSDSDININNKKMTVYRILPIIEAMRNFNAWFRDYSSKEKDKFERLYRTRFDKFYNVLLG